VSRHPSLGRPLGFTFISINYYVIARNGTLPRLGTAQCGAGVGSIRVPFVDIFLIARRDLPSAWQGR
jgi:hypothetical protein